MLTAKQPATYGYKSVYDLPTPPPTSRLSPPGYHQEIHQSYPALSRSHSPSNQSMSNPHRGLPRPAVLNPVPTPGPPSQQHHHSGPPPPSSTHSSSAPQVVQHGPPSHLAPPQGQQQQQQQPPPSASLQAQPQNQPPAWTSLPAPPSQWQGPEEPMKTWLQAKAEEERTRQEEEKTRQETIRLEQRRVEMDILRTSLSGGVPPPMVPVVFASMGNGGLLPQTMIDWAQQYLQNPQAQYAQIMSSQGLQSPEQAQQASAASGMGPGAVSYIQYPGSPSRQKGPVPTAGGRSSEAGSAFSLAHQPQPYLQGSQPEASPSIYFHHWQPPTSQTSSSTNRPGTPSESSKKRKVAAGPATGTQLNEPVQSPPPFVQTSLSNPPIGRRTHKRQRSDVSWQRPREQSQSEEEGSRPPKRATPPGLDSRLDVRESYEPRKHSVSSMLSAEPTSAEPRIGSHRDSRVPRHYIDDERDREHNPRPRTTPPPPPPPPAGL